MRGAWWYILDDDGDPVGPVNRRVFNEWWARFAIPDDPLTWPLRVAWNVLDDGTIVSTVFLGLDHGWRRDGLPVLYETMVFDAHGSERGCWRDSNRVAALATHDRVLAETRDRVTPDV